MYYFGSPDNVGQDPPLVKHIIMVKPFKYKQIHEKIFFLTIKYNTKIMIYKVFIFKFILIHLNF